MKIAKSIYISQLFAYVSYAIFSHIFLGDTSHHPMDFTRSLSFIFFFFLPSFHPSYPLYVFIQVQSNPIRCDCLALIDFQSKEEEGASCSNPEQESDSAGTLYNKH